MEEKKTVYMLWKGGWVGGWEKDVPATTLSIPPPFTARPVRMCLLLPSWLQRSRNGMSTWRCGPSLCAPPKTPRERLTTILVFDWVGGWVGGWLVEERG